MRAVTFMILKKDWLCYLCKMLVDLNGLRYQYTVNMNILGFVYFYRNRDIYV